MSEGPQRPRADARLLVLARGLRGFGAGALSVVFVVDLAAVGYDQLAAGVLVGLAMGAGAAWAIAAPRLEFGLGRRGLLLLGAALFAVGGGLLWWELKDPWIVVLALLLGGVVTGTADISPLGAAEQAGLASVSPGRERTLRYAVYNLSGYLGAALGAVAAVPLSTAPAVFGGPGTHDLVLALYGLLGLGLLPTYFALSAASEERTREPHRPLSPEARKPVLELSSLFAVDAFGGGLIANSLVTAFLVERFHPPVLSVGLILFGGNVAAAVSLLLAVPIANRIGLVRTMVFTHLPSDVLLIAVAFAPNLWAVGAFWVGRATLSQMDVPTRQAFVQSMVRPEERTAAAGYTTAGRSSQALGAPLTGALLNAGGPWIGGPFVLAGSIKIVYDGLVYRRFRHHEDGQG